jgi:hypothetical protein
MAFEDRQFDFVVCSHTLEDVRDPIWVCSELSRVGRAGYIEVPSRLEEQCFGVHGPWVGWSHHRWLVDIEAGRLRFVHKPHMLASRPEFFLPAAFADTLTPEDRVQTLFWKGDIDAYEMVFVEPAECDAYLADLVARARRGRNATLSRRPRSRLREPLIESSTRLRRAVARGA